MGRFLLTVVLGVALFAVVVYYFDWWKTDTPNRKSNTEPETEEALGELLYPRQTPRVDWHVGSGSPMNAVVVHGHTTTPEQVDVAAQVDAKVLCIGDEIPEGTAAAAGVACLIGEPFLQRNVIQGLADLAVIYRPWEEEATVRPKQVIAKLDPARILNEVALRRAKYNAAIAEYKGAEELYKEADLRAISAEKAYNTIIGGNRLIREEEYREKLLSRNKSFQDKITKKEGIKVAEHEQQASEIDLKEHTIRNELPVRCRIKIIHHKGEEAVKKLEPIVQIYSTERLRAEGMVDVPNRSRLHVGMPVFLEPTTEVAPRVLMGHRKEVTAVAVTRDPRKPRVISASEDKTVCVWDPAESSPRWVLYHPDAVRTVACTPPGAPMDLLLTGCANGDIYLWELDKLDIKKRRYDVSFADKLKAGHADGVTALAFGPVGAFFASGGADHRIQVWKTESREPLYTLSPGISPDGTITALSFTPETKLVAASTDNTLRVYDLHEKGAKQAIDPIPDRSGTVGQLGVDRDGRRMVFDQGRRLQILSTQDGIQTGILENPDGTTPFVTLALFSPDGSLMLTGGAPEGRLILWRTPGANQRGFELRQYVTREKAPVTCAAFFPDAGLSGKDAGSYAVSGCKDGHVYLWPVPNMLEVSQHRVLARLTMVGGAVDSGTRQIRVGVDVDNRDGRFLSGRPVTIVVEH
ncbi:MAG: hypothetical protein FJ271_14050 [Planctomycetes bacterium]|nr:hypothetical protein [Planctomycetota bacterium]